MNPAIEPAIQAYLAALRDVWTDVNFRRDFYGSFDKSVVVTVAEADVARLPRTGRAIRGLEGVRTQVNSLSKTGGSSIDDLLTATIFTSTSGMVNAEPPRAFAAGERLRDSSSALETALYASPPLSHRVHDAMGRKVDEHPHFDARIQAMDPKTRRIMTQMFVHRLVEHALREHHFDPSKPSDFNDWGSVERSMVTKLSELELRTENRYKIALFLNGPLFDDDSDQQLLPDSSIWKSMRLGPATDEMLGKLVEGYGYAAHLPLGASLANTAVMFELARSVDATVREYSELYPLAAELGRRVVDILRVVHGGDFGISHLSIDPLDWTMPYPSQDLHWEYRSDLSAFQPRRTAFWPTGSAVLSDAHLATIQSLLPVHMSGPDVKGFEVAIRRFRDAWERYQPTDPERLLDIAIALEAIFLSEVDSKELKFRLALRAARLLETDPIERRKVFDCVGRLYDVRSRIAHGASSDLKAQQRKKLETVQEEAPLVLRRAIQKVLEGRIPSGLDDESLSSWWRALELA